MTRKLKALGLAFVAVLAFGALSASAASAASFHSEQAHTIFDGAQPVAEDDVWTVNAGTIRCKGASYSGTSTSATAETVTVVPSYKECTAFGFVNAAIDVTAGCSFTWNASGTKTISCSGAIKVTAFNCWVKFATQTLSKVASFINSGAGAVRRWLARFNASGLKYTQESKSFPGCSSGTFTNGTYVGSATVTGTNTSGEQVGVWHS